MAAADHLSPRLFHSTNADLQPGDLIHPGHQHEDPADYHWGDDYKNIGHRDFTWASAGKPKTSFGSRHYEVEPTGLAHPYTLHERPNGLTARKDTPGEYPRQESMDPDSIHAKNWVSLAPLRVKGRVNGKGKPL